MGLGSILKPVLVTRQFDINALSIAGRNEVRAVYGGFGILMSLSLAIALQEPLLRNGICLTVAAALGGMAFGRLLSALLDRSINKWPLFYLFIEATCTTLLLTT